MKRLVLFVVFLLSTVASQAQWKSWNWQQLTLPSPFDQGYYLGIYFLPTNPQVGWVCGYNGAVLRTRDGGNTWRGVVIPNAPQLESIIFLDDNIGFCSGTNQFSPNQGGIYRTRDGGVTWEEITPVLLSGGSLQRASVWGCNFINANVGLVIGGGCGEAQMFFRTSDGGSSWSVFTANYPNSGLSHPKMLSADGVCYASSSGAVWKSEDGGRTWKLLCTTGPAYWQENMKIFGNSFCLATAGTSCIGGTEPAGDIRFSSDLGRSWLRYSTGAAMFGTYMLNDSTGWAAGFNRSVYRTSDYGKTWTPYRCGLKPSANFDDLFFINDTLGYVVGDGIYRTVKPQSAPALQVSGDTVFCEGGSVKLSVSGSYTEYHWSNGSTGSSIVVTESGDYFVSVRKSNDCELISNNVRVKVLPKPKPALQANRSANHLCFNDSLILSISALFPRIMWSTGETSQSIIVRTPGTYSVDVTDTNGCTAKDSIVVTGGTKIVPAINQGAPTRFCEGDSLVLTAQEGFDQYIWSDGRGTQSIVIGSSGRYSVAVRDSFGCLWQSDTIDVTVDSNPIFIVNVPNRVFDIDSTLADAMTCDSITIRNMLSDTLVIDKARLLRNIEFSAPQAQLSLRIPPFAEVGLRICYRPSELYEQRDTLIIGDYCHRVIYLRSAGVPNIYTSTSRCNVSVRAVTTAIRTRGLFVFPATPNPSSSTLRMQIVVSAESEFPISELCDLMGQSVVRATISRRSSLQSSSQISVFDADFNTSELANGIYLLRVQSSIGTDCQTVIIQH